MCFIQWVRQTDCKSAVRYPDEDHPPSFPEGKASINPSGTVRFEPATAPLSFPPLSHRLIFFAHPSCSHVDFKMAVGSIDSLLRHRLSSEPATVRAFELILCRCWHHAFDSLSMPLHIVYAVTMEEPLPALSCPASMP